MDVSTRDQGTVITYLRSMQMGSSGIENILRLYADNGVYVEHLTSNKGEARTHSGKAAIRAALTEGMKWNPPDLRVTLDQLEIEGDELVARWTCNSDQFPRQMKGVDRYQIRDGKISRLETRLDSA